VKSGASVEGHVRMHIAGKWQWQSYAIFICCCLGHVIMGMPASAHGVQTSTISIFIIPLLCMSLSLKLLLKGLWTIQ